MINTPKLDVGTVVPCTQHNITHLNSASNACRIQCVNDTWVAVSPEKKAGLIVFIRTPPKDLTTLSAIQITEVRERVAFAEPIASD